MSLNVQPKVSPLKAPTEPKVQDKYAMGIQVAKDGAFDDKLELLLKLSGSTPPPQARVKLQYYQGSLLSSVYFAAASWLGSTPEWVDAPALLPALSLQPKGKYCLRGLQANCTYYIRAYLGLPKAEGKEGWDWRLLCKEEGVEVATLTTAAVQERQAAAAEKLAASEARAAAKRTESAQQRRQSLQVQARAKGAAVKSDAVSTQSVNALQEARALCAPGSIAARQAKLMAGGKRAAAAPAASSSSDATADIQEVQRLREKLSAAQAQLDTVQAQLDHSRAQPAAMEAQLQQLAARERELRIQLDDLETPSSWGQLEQELLAEGFARPDVRLVLSLFEAKDADFKRKLLQRIDELVEKSGVPRKYVREAAAVYELRVNGGQDVSVDAVLGGAGEHSVPEALRGASASLVGGDSGQETDGVLAFISAWVQVHYPDSAV